jgi:hypothetical protein
MQRFLWRPNSDARALRHFDRTQLRMEQATDLSICADGIESFYGAKIQ